MVSHKARVMGAGAKGAEVAEVAAVAEVRTAIVESL
jgi:hypothetical protein